MYNNALIPESEHGSHCRLANFLIINICANNWMKTFHFDLIGECWQRLPNLWALDSNTVSFSITDWSLIDTAWPVADAYHLWVTCSFAEWATIREGRETLLIDIARHAGLGWDKAQPIWMDGYYLYVRVHLCEHGQACSTARRGQHGLAQCTTPYRLRRHTEPHLPAGLFQAQVPLVIKCAEQNGMAQNGIVCIALFWA